MHIAGLQKMTLLDYPGQVACTVFLQGCNFRCPFCHNSSLLSGAGEYLMDDAQLLAFLEKRVGLLDGVCVTGGEPTLQKELLPLLKKVKALGYRVKLDTNGSCPEVLKAAVEAGTVDYVAMDIKNGPQQYAQTAGTNPAMLGNVEESIRYLLTDAVDYEFRTTVVEELHTSKSVQEMGRWLRSLREKPAKRWYLQQYMDRDSVLSSGLHAPSPEKMGEYAEILAPFAMQVSLRGVE